MSNNTDVEIFMTKFVKNLTGENTVDMDLSFLDYGMESMTIASLAGELTDKFCIDIDPVVLYESPTIRYACEELRKKLA